MSGGAQPTPGVSLPFGATVTILFSDIRGFTEYTEQYGDEAAYRVLRQHSALVRKEIEAFGGRVVKTQGDSFMVYFTTARAAILCAIGIQRSIGDETVAQQDTRIAIGIGINTGEPIQEGGDFFGSTVNLAARICAVAGPGHILISETTRYVAGRIEAVDYVDHGLRELKGFQEPQRVFEVNWGASAARVAVGGQASRELRAELGALAERFSRLGAEMLDTSHAMRQAGPPPGDGLAHQLVALSAAFGDFRGRLLQRAAALGVETGAPEGIATLVDAEPILAAIQEAESRSLEAAPAGAAMGDKHTLEVAVQRALSVLTRVLLIGHRDDPVFHPLLECQGRASDLRLKLSRALAGESEYNAQRVDEAIQPFSDLLALVVGRENLDDEKFSRIEDSATRAFGRPLALAGTRGRLFVQGVEAPARPAPTAAAPPAPAASAIAATPTAPAPPARAEERTEPARAAHAPESRAPAPEPAEMVPPADPRGAAVPWWAAASAAWRAWKTSGVATAHALRAAVAKHPYLLAVPVTRSAEYDEGRLAADYFLLLEHVENVSPAFVRTAL
ncbi:MAG TPA: adenylate/guanylate cyclase domain-containing protein, partial [Methylomirabilota bacterium]|nr:adenylate/guanylate cyclase domain-containing protein [Methylomirabilota bacterium]